MNSKLNWAENFSCLTLSTICRTSRVLCIGGRVSPTSLSTASGSRKKFTPFSRNKPVANKILEISVHSFSNLSKILLPVISDHNFWQTIKFTWSTTVNDMLIAKKIICSKILKMTWRFDLSKSDSSKKKDLQAQINSQLFYGERACFKGTGSWEFFAKGVLIISLLSTIFIESIQTICQNKALDMSIKKRFFRGFLRST